MYKLKQRKPRNFEVVLDGKIVAEIYFEKRHGSRGTDITTWARLAGEERRWAVGYTHVSDFRRDGGEGCHNYLLSVTATGEENLPECVTTQNFHRVV